MAELLPVLTSAKEKGLKLTFHMAEVSPREGVGVMLCMCAGSYVSCAVQSGSTILFRFPTERKRLGSY